jgi:hypothetical protein
MMTYGEIKKKHPIIAKLILKRKYRSVSISNDTNLCDLFSWNKSLEGYDFWHYIDVGNFWEAKNINPKAFISIKDIFEKL